MYNPVPTYTTGDTFTAANANTYWRDNFSSGVPDIFTTLGDIAYATAANAATRLGIGAEGKVLGVSSGIPAWITDPAKDLITTLGDILYGTAADTLARRGIGSEGQMMTVEGGIPQWSDFNILKTLGADNSFTGITIVLTATSVTAFGKVCYINASGEAALADADAIATSGACVICVETAGIDAAASGKFLIIGSARDNAWAWTIGGLIYLSTAVGTMTQTAPSGANDVIQVLGVALNADTILFNPQLVMVEHV